MLKRLGLTMIAVVAFFAVVITPQSEIFAEGWQYDFQTEDGKWDGYFETASGYNNVQIQLFSVSPEVSPSNLMVRLCNRSSGNCTSYKTFGNGYLAHFTNMVYPASFNVDIIDTVSGSVKGGIHIYTY
ncbi:hypothetical protein [Paludifilum halophilum]|uniref:Uncharacterized protein n=1 Tax=Paludifilum halophilum TaxID=1642702 RepID=A0A235BA65_9BACL|nr:hypothetical protein [Paludifilum halophilum]OYD08475.1 hypothetical protein CHM34_06500 [Paludifilum halophilum]